jgi:hypothetical protein
MTETLVIRLKPGEIARIDSAARKRAMTRSAYVRTLLKREIEAEPEKGVGWPERLKELEAQARDLKVHGHPEDEMRALEQERWK